MRIQHNIAALNAHRQLGNNNNSVAKNLEKLSSGYRINRAGDDAAGLAISEKMRAQITGLDTAQKNAQDGISLVQTAEGALTEVHSMLNRMIELADQSANGTYDDSVDRANLQKELDSLRSEIDRIADGTNFNGINLLDGNLGGPKMSSTAGVSTVASVTGTAGTAPVVTAATTDTIVGTEGNVAKGATLKLDLRGADITTGTDTTGNKATISIAGTDIVLDLAQDTTYTDGELAQMIDGKTIEVEGVTFTATAATDGTVTFTAADGKTTGVVAAATSAVTITTSKTGGTGTITDTAAATDVVTASEGLDAKNATLKFNTSGMKIAAPTDGSTGAKVSFSVGGTDVTLDVTADMDDKAIAAALVGKTIIVDGKTFTGKLDTAGGTAVTFEAEAGATSGVVGAAGTFVGTPAAGAVGAKDAVAGSATEVEMDFDGRIGSDLIGGSAKIGNTTYSFVENAGDAAAGTTAIVIAKNATATDIATAVAGAVTEAGFTVASTGSKVTLTETAGAANSDGNPVYGGVDAPKVEFAGVGLTLQIGDTADSFNQLTVSIDSMKSSSLGIDTISIASQAGAKSAVQAIKNAINTVSSTRGNLGAIQNRLEHTINNLSVTTENMTAAESRIRDVDMAEEMMSFTKNNILTQASQAMLAQANQLPQGVLQLLQ